MAAGPLPWHKKRREIPAAAHRGQRLHERFAKLADPEKMDDATIQQQLDQEMERLFQHFEQVLQGSPRFEKIHPSLLCAGILLSSCTIHPGWKRRPQGDRAKARGGIAMGRTRGRSRGMPPVHTVVAFR